MIANMITFHERAEKIEDKIINCKIKTDIIIIIEDKTIISTIVEKQQEQ